MRSRSQLRSPKSVLACAVLAFGACSETTHLPTAARTAEVTVTTTTAIPTDGQCTHIVATRLADFQVSEYKGLLAGAKLKALPGENRITATAYAQPCANEPASPAWVADEQIVTLVDGANTVNLS